MVTRLLTLLLAFLLVPPAVADGGQERPNILILMAEDMSARVGAFGDPVATTPNLDRLAASGVRFPNTFTTAGVCAPSRAAHITGMHQVSIGAQHMRARSFEPMPYRAVPPPDVKAYPELLRMASYYTLTNHKLDYQFSDYGAGTGPFTIWDYEGDDPDWNRREEGQPFFALINFGMTHESRMFYKNVEKQNEAGWKQMTDAADVTVPPYYPDTPVIRRDIAQQYDNVHEMDRVVGEWLQRLEEDGLAENTIVIWTTDHGDGLPRAKREIYDSGIRVPMILRLPKKLQPPGGIHGVSEDRRLVSFIDFAPSVLAWAGVAAPDYMQGQPVLADQDMQRDFVFASKDRLDEMPFRERAVRDGQFKYIFNHRPGEIGGKPLAYREQLATMAVLHEWFDAGRMNTEQAF
jgi:arylsulfatase A-like enzyme